MNNILETFKNLGPARLGIMAGIVFLMLVFFVFLSFRIGQQDFQTLYTQLSAADATTIAGELEASGIAYDVSPDGTTVRVAEAEIGRARMVLAQKGLPNGGSMGYEIFDNQSGFGTTNFVQNINQVRALEGELARSVQSLDPVKGARVHLVLPQRELFSRESRPASASVVVNLSSGKELSREQITAIQSLVSSAVPDLKITNVSIVDSTGRLLARGGEEDANLLTVKAEEMRRGYETRLTNSVEDLVGRIVGFGRVRANVTAEMNFDRISTNEEVFDPEQQVVRSSQVVEERSSETEPAENNVGVEQNVPGQEANGLAEQTAPTAQSERTEETTNYEISRTVRNQVREVGEIQRLSVAVLVDGVYTKNAEGVDVYQPRSPEEIAQIETLVKGAMGFDSKRGDSVTVTNMQFAVLAEDIADDTKLFGFEKADLLDAAEILTVAIMIILVVLLVLQPMVGRLLASGDNKLDEEVDFNQIDLLTGRPASPALAGPDGMPAEDQSADEAMIDMHRVEGKVKAATIKKVEDIVTAYPNETVAVLRGWMQTDL